jgi:hypothetical protein
MGITNGKIRIVKQAIRELGKWDIVKIMELTALPYHEIKQIQKKIKGEETNGKKIKA